VSDELDPDSQAHDVQKQHRRLKRAFVHGWVTPARGPVTFDDGQLDRIEHVRDHGGWLNREEMECLQRLRAGARRGDPLPAAPATREPYVDGFREDFDLQTVGSGDEAHVVILFSHELWPGVRFGHRFPLPGEADGYEDVWLKEEVETGALARQMRQHPRPDDDGIIWTSWGWTPSR
jgi:hypothetical protein